MKILSVISTLFLVCFLLAEDVVSATYDLTGTWNYTISYTQVHGPCPPDEDTTGTCSITQTGDSFTLVFLTGRVCDPISMCTYYGTISAEDYTCSNGEVDAEGGIITNTIDFTAVSLTSASGPGTSTYVHPEDFQCTWCFDFTLTSNGNNPGEGNPPVVTNPQAAPEEIPGDGNTTALLTVSVADPDGDLASVAIDLSSLGGSPSQAMYDNGTNGDVSAGDGTYSIETTASPATPITLKALKVTATDQMGNTGSNVISLFATSAIIDTLQPQSTNTHTVLNGIAEQTLNITYFLDDSHSYQIMQAGVSEVTLTVKEPDGEIYTTESMSTTVKTLHIRDAEAGTWTYEVSNEGGGSLFLSRVIQASQVSYQIDTVTGGVGIVSGTVTDAGTSGNLTGVLLTTDTGGFALSVDGYYVMVTVAGVFTVTASSFGYQAESEANVTLIAGQTEAIDFSLTAVTIEELQLVGITTDLTSIPQTSVPVKLTANATGPSTIYYRFLYKAGYGTPSYNTPGGFVIAQNWTTNNSANIMFPSADNYIVIVQASEDPTGVWVFGDPQGGMSIYVGNPSDLQVKSITTSNLSGIPTAGQPITVIANAVGSVGAYYRFLYKAGYGTLAYNTPGGFVIAQNWSADSTADITFPSADNYIVIVQASEDSTGVWAFGDPQGGLNIAVGAQ